MPKKHIPQKMITDARELYLKYGGRKIVQIEKEMRDLGWPFNRQVLYSTTHSSGVTPGWPERFGWRQMLKPEQLHGLGQRNGGRNRFEQWLSDNFPEWTWTWRYQRYIYRRLAEITTGANHRLMIFMPPRHGKSEMVTVRYTAWRLLQNPRLNVILGSYNQRLADKFSRKIKRIVLSRGVEEERSKGESPPVPRSSTPLLRSVSEWETSGGGVVRSVGVGAGIAGFGAGLIVIDDPVRNRADAESRTYRDRVDEWFKDDIYTRMEPGASIILIQTRWHEDDLAGRLLKEQENGGDKWEVISLPALAEEPTGAARTGAASILACHDAKHRNGDAGEGRDAARSSGVASKMLAAPVDVLGRKPGRALCPARFNEAALLKIKRKLGSYSFSALYQQSPVPAEGGQFKREWFRKIVAKAPEGLNWKRGYDLAVSLKESADYTASFRCAKDDAGNLYIADGYRKRIEYPDQRRYLISRFETEPTTEHGIEAALHGQAIVQDLRRDHALSSSAIRQVRVRGDKLTRALAWLNLAEEGKVILVRGAWIEDFLDEVCSFPTGKHDDQVDAVSLAVEMLSQPRYRVFAF